MEERLSNAHASFIKKMTEQRFRRSRILYASSPLHAIRAFQLVLMLMLFVSENSLRSDPPDQQSSRIVPVEKRMLKRQTLPSAAYGSTFR
jgi:hypothetical protein